MGLLAIIMAIVLGLAVSHWFFLLFLLPVVGSLLTAWDATKPSYTRPRKRRRGRLKR